MFSCRLAMSLGLAAALGLCWAVAGVAVAQDQAPVPPKAPRLAKTEPNDFQSHLDKQSRTVKRRANKGLWQFKDSKGTITLTNKPDKYKGRKGYVEVYVKYEHIRPAPHFRKPLSAAAYTNAAIMELVKYYSKLYALDEHLVLAVIHAESAFNPHAVSPAGARGLMQLMPETAAEMGVTDIFDPAQNIAGGTQYLAKMLNLFENRVELALAAYNAGPNAVKQNGGIPPYAETQEYIKRVYSLASEYSGKKLKPDYRVLAKKPRADSLPAKAGAYIIHFHSGYTQPVDKVIDEDPYYYVQFGNRTALVRKEHVAKVVKAA